MLRRFSLAGILFALCGAAHAGGITFSGATDLGNSTTSVFSSNYTVGSGANRVLVVCVVVGANDSMSATYNGVSMTQAANDVGQFMYLFYLLNPASGSNSLVVTDNSGTQYIQVIVSDYYNVKQTGQPDGSGTADDTGTNDTFSGSFSTSQAGATVIGCAGNTGNGTAPTVSGSFTRRIYAVQFGDTLLADYGPVAPAGSVTLTATIHNGGFKQGQAFLSLIPFRSGGGALMTTGVGD